MKLRRGAILLIAVLPGACSVGPNYHSPPSMAPAGWAETNAAVTTNSNLGLAEWWKTLGDDYLDTLITRAVTSNLDIKAASARVKAARALRGAVVADFLPTVNANASYTVARRSQNSLAFPVQLLDTEIYEAGFDATWEIDVFGGKRRALEAANADLQSIQEDRRSVLVSLLAEVARNYVELCGAQKRVSIAHESLRAQQETVEITQMRFEKGVASELDVFQAKALLSQIKSQVPALETAVKQASHRLCVLLGQAPGALEAELSVQKPIPLAPPEIPIGLPSDLLLRRPDVRRSERQLAAATARIGVADAELFPKFFLTGSAGFQSLDTSNLISPASKFWSAGPSIRWRLLEYPRLRAEIKAQTAQQEQAFAEFQQVVLTSLEEVENALVAYGKEKERYQFLTETVAASRRSVDLSNQLYLSGLGEFLNVLISQRALFESEDALAESERTVTQNLVALYKALGGGWEPQATTASQ
jgi:NodT family efflux transporter outer membrane factor (OMF) lipoprotein